MNAADAAIATTITKALGDCPNWRATSIANGAINTAVAPLEMNSPTIAVAANNPINTQ